MCLYQVGSESAGQPPDDSASLHTAETICVYCKRSAATGGDGSWLYVDLSSQPLAGYIHDTCLELWIMGLGLRRDESAA